MKRPIYRFTREAAQHAANLEKVREKAALAHAAVGGGEILFLPFKAEGKQFALYARTIIEIGWFPHRAPARALRTTKRIAKVRK